MDSSATGGIAWVGIRGVLFSPTKPDRGILSFYEKVVKVKADVAAISIFILTSRSSREWGAVKGIAVRERSS
jgi:hypothetical protein